MLALVPTDLREGGGGGEQDRGGEGQRAREEGGAPEDTTRWGRGSEEGAGLRRGGDEAED